MKLTKHATLAEVERLFSFAGLRVVHIGKRTATRRNGKPIPPWEARVEIEPAHRRDGVVSCHEGEGDDSAEALQCALDSCTRALREAASR